MVLPFVGFPSLTPPVGTPLQLERWRGDLQTGIWTGNIYYLWTGRKSQVTGRKSQVASCKSQVASCKLRVKSYEKELRVPYQPERLN